MQTPSHFLMTAALKQAYPRIPIVGSAFLLGSVAPDLPLWILSIGGVIYYHGMLGWSQAETARLMFDELFFRHPLWIVSHNFLHAPLIILTGLAIVWSRRQNIGSRSRWFFWFLIACLLHTTVDIFTHVDDGPLIFFPFDWVTRFRSIISYYDDRYYGREFQLFEQVINVVFIIYLLFPHFYRWIRRFDRSKGL